MLTALEWVVTFFLGVHFGTPLAYYAYLRRVMERPWGIRLDDNYRPSMAVILPTFNESDIIEKRLDNIKQQEYPRELVEVIVVDSSSDETADIVKNWSKTNNDLCLKLVKQNDLKGKLHAMDMAIQKVSSNCRVAVFTDADAFWEPKALSKAARYFADLAVGALTACIRYGNAKDKLLENTYRDYHNFIHIAESKVHSTPVHNGPFVAVRMDLIREVGLPLFDGSDDSAFGSFVALRGYRALQVDDITVEEPFRGNQVLRKIRRAQHLLLIFKRIKSYTEERKLYRKSSFDRIWKLEWWLTILNPWLLLFGTGFLLFDVLLSRSLIGLTLLIVGLASLLSKTFRMWVFQQFYLIVAAIRNLWTKETMWRK